MPNVETIEAKLDGLKELIEEKFKSSEEAHGTIRDHLARLNGQVAKNTEFRISMVAKMSILVAGGGIVLPILVSAAVSRFL